MSRNKSQQSPHRTDYPAFLVATRRRLSHVNEIFVLTRTSFLFHQSFGLPLPAGVKGRSGSGTGDPSRSHQPSPSPAPAEWEFPAEGLPERWELGCMD